MAIIGIARFFILLALLLGNIANVYGLKGIYFATGVLAIVCIFFGAVGCGQCDPRCAQREHIAGYLKGLGFVSPSAINSS